MATADWHIAVVSVAPGARVRASVELTELPDGSRVRLPVALIHGARPGPTLYLGAAIHGDEANGVAIATRVLAQVSASTLAGRLVCVPVQNPLAFQVDHRVPVGLYLKTPLDQAPMDPWTTFPGDPAGTITERLSHALFTLIRGCDAAIDVHTPTRGGRYVPITILPHPSLPAFAEADALGRAFGSGWIMATDQGMYVRDGILCVEATRAGVPCFTFEIGEGGRVEEEATETGSSCVLNAMRHLGMLSPVTEPRAPSVRMSAFVGLRASRGGLLTTDVGLGARVGQGATLARIHDVYGDLVETITAPRDGYFVRSTTFAAVAAGERVATLGVE
jgi:predicted deacylase